MTATPNISYGGERAWVALLFTTMQSEKWVAIDVDAHITMAYLRGSYVNQREEV